MNRGPKTFICLVCLAALTTQLHAVLNDSKNGGVDVVGNSGDASKSGDGTYSSIWLRNVFDLKPAPLPVVNAPPPAAPPPNVKLQGITTILGGKRAIFSVQEAGGPGRPPGKEESYMLKENERQGALEVLEINPKDRTVKIKVDELVSTITFETNKTAGPGPGNMAAGGVPRPTPVPPPPTFNPSGGYTPAAPVNGGNQAMPFRPVRTTDNSQITPQSGGGGYVGGYSQASYQVAQGGAGGTAGGVSIPGSLFNQASSQLTQAPQVEVPPIEQQTVALAVQHQLHAAEMAAGTYPPLPPLPAGTPSLDSSGDSSTTFPSMPTTSTPVLPPWLQAKSHHN